MKEKEWGWEESREKMESKDKNKEDKYKDKEYERKMGRPKMPIRLEKYRGGFYSLEAICRRQSFSEVFRMTHK